MLSEAVAPVLAECPTISFGAYEASAGPASASATAPAVPTSPIRRGSFIALSFPWVGAGTVAAEARLRLRRDQSAEHAPDAAVVAIELHLVDRVRVPGA